MCCSLCILCSFRTAPTTTTMWGACGQKRAGTRRACRADVQQRDRAHGAGRRGEPHCLNVQMLASQWVWQKSVSILAEEQNAGRVVDYFYRMEFHITPRFFSDSNYLFFFFVKCILNFFTIVFRFFFVFWFFLAFRRNPFHSMHFFPPLLFLGRGRNYFLFTFLFSSVLCVTSCLKL